MAYRDKGILLYYDWIAPLEEIDDETFKKLILAMIRYSRDGDEPPSFDGIAKIASQFIFPQIKRAKVNAMNGGKGGSAAANKNRGKRFANSDANITHTNTNTETKTKTDNKYKETCDAVVEYLNRATGKQFRKGIAATERLIRSRLREGFTVDDFYKVIDNKCAEWINDAEMNKYLRPETLFGSKFDTYLNQNATPGKLFGEGDNDLLPY